MMIKIAKKSRAIVAAPLATPEKPNAPATIAITAAIIAQVNKSIVHLLIYGCSNDSSSTPQA
jgi:hypothetical protein